MTISYKKLRKIFIDKDMKKKDSIEVMNINLYAVSKFNREEDITIDILVKICTVLDYSFDNIMKVANT